MIPQTIAELDEIRKECKKMVTKRATVSATAAIVPIPGTDIVADVGMLLQLLPAINERFGLSESQLSGLDANTKAIVYGIIQSIGSKVIGRIITKEIIIQILKKVGVRVATKQVTKYIPIVGQAAAATVSFSAMKMVGNSHVDDCYEVAKRILEAQVTA